MKVVTRTSETATVVLTADDLMILSNAIREAKVAIEDWEFSTLIGAEPAEAEALRRAISDLLRSLK